MVGITNYAWIGITNYANEAMQDGIKQKIKGRQLIMHCDIPEP